MPNTTILSDMERVAVDYATVFGALAAHASVLARTVKELDPSLTGLCDQVLELTDTAQVKVNADRLIRRHFGVHPAHEDLEPAVEVPGE